MNKKGASSDRRVVNIIDRINRLANGDYEGHLPDDADKDDLGGVLKALNRLGKVLREREESHKFMMDKIQGIEKRLMDVRDNAQAVDEIRGDLGKAWRAGKKMEQPVAGGSGELEEAGRRYENLFKNNPMPMWVLELPSLRFLDVNESAMLHYGYSREEFLNMNAADIRPEEDRQSFLNIDRTRKGTLDSGIWKHLKKDGTLLYSHITVHEMMYDGRPSRLVMSVDVTARVKMEQEIRELNQVLEQRVAKRTEQLEAAVKELESFTYSVSHDLRAPLRAVNGYSKILIEEYQKHLDDEGIRLLQQVSNNARRMGKLVDDLLAFSRIGKREINRMSIDTDAMVGRVVGDLLPGEWTTTKIVVGPLKAIQGDPSLVPLVFQNLILNAIKYSSKKPSPRVEIGMVTASDQDTFFVRDNGAGFDMKYHHKLFGVFQRLHGDEEFEGTGVGLAIVDRIVKLHGGRVWAEARPGEGATFYLTFGGSKHKN